MRHCRKALGWVLLNFIWIFMMAGGAWADTTVEIPFRHLWYTDVAGAADEFTYLISGATGTEPLPVGAAEDGYHWTIRGGSGTQITAGNLNLINDRGYSREIQVGVASKLSTGWSVWLLEDTLSLSIPFTGEGIYDYHVAAYVPTPMAGYVYEPNTYTVSIRVTRDDAADVHAIFDGSGIKYDTLLLDPSYTRELLNDIQGDRETAPSEQTSQTTGTGTAGTAAASVQGDGIEEHPVSGSGSGVSDDKGENRDADTAGSIAPTRASSPRTGDLLTIGLYGGLIVLAAGMILLIFLKNKRDEEEEYW